MEKQSAVKKNGDYVNNILTRPISTRISAALAKTSITPNQASVFALSLAVLASILLITQNWALHAMAGALIQLYLIFDCVDGELARLKGMASKFGKWFDGVVDVFASSLLLFAMGIGAFPQYGLLSIAVAFAAVIGYNLAGFTYYYSLVVFERENSKLELSAGFVNKIIALFKSFSVGIQILILTLGAVTNQLFLALVLFAVWSNVIWIGRVWKYYAKRNEGKPQ